MYRYVWQLHVVVIVMVPCKRSSTSGEQATTKSMETACKCDLTQDGDIFSNVTRIFDDPESIISSVGVTRKYLYYPL